MTRRRTLGTALALAATVAALLGPAGVNALEPRTVTASVVVPAANFYPTVDSWSYQSVGYLESDGYGTFAAPIVFPVAEVTIKKLTLYVYDLDDYGICAYLYRSAPGEGMPTFSGQVCSTGGSTADPQVLTTTAISPRKIDTNRHASYVMVNFSGLYGVHTLKLYAVKVTYTYETGG